MNIKTFEKRSFLCLNLYLETIQRGLLISQQSRPQDISLSRSGDTGQILQCMLMLLLLVWFRADSLVVFGFGVCEDVRFQVG